MISIPIIFKTTRGDIQGVLQVTYDTLTFSPDRSSLKKTLMKNLKKKGMVYIKSRE